jgi:hypothetical protein
MHAHVQSGCHNPTENPQALRRWQCTEEAVLVQHPFLSPAVISECLLCAGTGQGTLLSFFKAEEAEVRETRNLA